MEVVDTAQINSFAPIAAQTDFPVSPSEEAVFILTASQLQDVITQTIEKAVEPLQDRIGDMEKMIAAQDAKIATLTSTQEQDVNRICLDIAYDRQRLARLERVEPQSMQKDRGDILRALLAANGGKMLTKDARQKMHMSKQAFTNLLAVVEGVESRPYRTDKRQRLLVLE